MYTTLASATERAHSIAHPCTGRSCPSIYAHSPSVLYKGVWSVDGVLGDAPKSSHDFLGFRRLGVSTCYNAISYTGYRDASDGSCKRVPVWSARNFDDAVCRTYPLVPMYWTNPATVLASEPWACSTSPLICSSAKLRLRDKIGPPLPVSLSTWY